jgi:serine/threonine protein kinase
MNGQEPIPAGALIAPGYEVLDHLHRSNAFDVYDVWSAERRCRCVAKTPRPDRLNERGVRSRLEREGRLLRRLSHPHLLRGYEVLKGPPPVIVTETLRGQTLARLLDTAPALKPREAAVLGLQLCSAVGYLHEQDYLHLDLKPSNIVVDGGRAIVVDLSLARKPGPARPGIGTWCYLAPEQALGGELGPPADVWGIGVVLYESLTGEPLFDDERDSEPGSRATPESETPEAYPQLESRAPRIRSVRRVPPELARAIDACLDPDSAGRPSIEELARALESVPGAGSPRALRGTAA